MPIKNLKEIVQTIENSQKTLYILCGLPYSGKTYVAKKILGKTACVYISVDNILKDLGYDWDSNKLPDEQGWERIFDISYQKSEEALKNGSNVLYDSTNHTRTSRDTLRKVAHEVSANAKVIYINVPVGVVWERWEENSAQKNRSVVNKELVEATIKSFELPTEDQSLITLQNDY